MKYERRRLDELTPSPDNPRSITKAAKKALAASIKRFGFVQPVIVNETTGNVVGGHQRLEVLREQGATEVDVVVVAWTEAEERLLNVSLNNQGAQGEFTEVHEYLEQALRGLSLDEFSALRLDELVIAPSTNSYNDRMTEVEDVDVSTINDAIRDLDQRKSR
jgi:ParB-like chromosome segregation protein Spo0J